MVRLVETDRADAVVPDQPKQVDVRIVDCLVVIGAGQLFHGGIDRLIGDGGQQCPAAEVIGDVGSGVGALWQENAEKRLLTGS